MSKSVKIPSVSPKRRMNLRWLNRELDDGETRKRFRCALMRLKGPSMVTPYWDCDYIDWLVYEATLVPCTARVESITRDVVTLEVNCSGVSTEGICLDATFEIPTREFTRAELAQMVHDFEYVAVRDVKLPDGRDGFTFGPFENRKYMTRLEWWYDGGYDETGCRVDED